MHGCRGIDDTCFDGGEHAPITNHHQLLPNNDDADEHDHLRDERHVQHQRYLPGEDKPLCQHHGDDSLCKRRSLFTPTNGHLFHTTREQIDNNERDCSFSKSESRWQRFLDHILAERRLYVRPFPIDILQHGLELATIHVLVGLPICRIDSAKRVDLRPRYLRQFPRYYVDFDQCQRLYLVGNVVNSFLFFAFIIVIIVCSIGAFHAIPDLLERIKEWTVKREKRARDHQEAMESERKAIEAYHELEMKLKEDRKKEQRERAEREEREKQAAEEAKLRDAFKRFMAEEQGKTLADVDRMFDEWRNKKDKI